MKILFCTPYLRSDCGIAVWGRHILSAYKNSKNGISIDTISLDRKVDAVETLSIIQRFYYGIKEYLCILNELKKKIDLGYDLIHMTSSASLGLLPIYLMLNIAKKKNVKTIVHFHFGRIPNLLQKKNWECKLLLKVCKKATLVIVIDETSYQALLSAGYKNVKFLPNPIAPSLNSLIEQNKDVSRIKNKIVFVGHVVRSKGVYELVEAIKNVPSVTLSIVGNAVPAIKNELISLAGDSISRITFTGPVSHETVIQEMLSSDIFLLPTYTEGFPNVILESMACGSSIISTSVGAIPQMLSPIEDGDCGIVIPSKDVKSIISSIEKFISDDKFRLKCGVNAKKKVNMRYNIESVWNNLYSIWIQVLNN